LRWNTYVNITHIQYRPWACFQTTETNHWPTGESRCYLLNPDPMSFKPPTYDVWPAYWPVVVWICSHMLCVCNHVLQSITRTYVLVRSNDIEHVCCCIDSCWLVYRANIKIILDLRVYTGLPCIALINCIDRACVLGADSIYK
jgi:hypothetical protein